MNDLPPPTVNTLPPPTQLPQRRLTRSRTDRVLGGVCAGLAERYGWETRTVRILAVVSILLPGPQVLAYIAGWLLLPDGDDGAPIVDVDKAADDVRSAIKT